jgi:tryptophan-rich sensory protein
MSTTNIKAAAKEDTGQQQWHWYQGLAFWAIVQLLTFTLSGLTSIASGNTGKNLRENLFGNASYFRELKQSVIAPPSWVFAPAWTINNFFALWAALRVLNKPKGTAGRSTFLALQAATWVEFVLFNAAYFSLRSPINALLLTITFFAFTIASGFVALFQLKDTNVALLLTTLYIWLIIASTAATFQVLWNHDDLYNVGPFAEPIPSLMKGPQ